MCVPRTATLTRLALALAFIATVAPAHALPDDLPGPDGLLPEPSSAPPLLPAAPDAAAAARYAAAAAYSRKHGGRALLVVDGDRLVFEDYENGHEAERAHHLWSGTKTFMCALVAAAAADHRFDLDTRLDAHLPDLDKRRAALTVRDLLSLSSGLSESGEILTTDMLRARPKVRDKEAWALREITAQYPPGERFRYAASPFVFLAALARRALDEDLITYLDRRVFAPIGMRQSNWLRDDAGHPFFSFGAYTTARGWARFGMLLRDDGRFLGREILPPGLLHRCFEPSPAMPAYGLGLWRNAPASNPLWLPPVLHDRFAKKGPILSAEGPADLYAAVGYDDNRLYVIPSRHLVIVRLGAGAGSFTDRDLVNRILALGTSPH